MNIDIHSLSDVEASRLMAESKYGPIWEPGVRVIIDNELCVLEKQIEVDEVIERLQKAAAEYFGNQK